MYTTVKWNDEYKKLEHKGSGFYVRTWIWLQSQVHEDQNIKTDFEAVTDVRPEPYSYMQQPVLEAWLTLKDPQSGNDHLQIPEVYESLARARVLRYVFWNFTHKILSTRVRHTTFSI